MVPIGKPSREGWYCTYVVADIQDAATVAATIQAVKQQRELYTAFRDLFIRHARLSHDAVDTLRKKVEQRQAKIETLRAAQKPGWEGEVGKLVSGAFCQCGEWY